MANLFGIDVDANQLIEKQVYSHLLALEALVPGHNIRPLKELSSVLGGRTAVGTYDCSSART